MQVAPYDLNYIFDNSSSVTTVFNSDISSINSYHGGQYQEAVSALTNINNTIYNDQDYGVFGYEWYSDPNDRSNGYITWSAQGEPSWKVTAGSIGPDPTVDIGPRIIPEEPMYIIFNFGMSPSFQPQDWAALQFPSKMYIDYVRVYQRDGLGDDALSCDPPNYPTADYINNHLNAYSNPNLTTWAQAGYDFPRNQLYDGCG